MEIKTRLIKIFSSKKPTATQWILIISISLMIVGKFSKNQRNPLMKGSNEHIFYKINGIDTRYDYVEPYAPGFLEE